MFSARVPILDYAEKPMLYWHSSGGIRGISSHAFQMRTEKVDEATPNSQACEWYDFTELI